MRPRPRVTAPSRRDFADADQPARLRALRPAAAAIVLATVVAACGDHRLPPLRLPQVEQGTAAVQGGGERYRDHRTCFGSSKSSDEMIRCMEGLRWQFVAHGLVYPEPECWQARERGETERLVPNCFLRAPGQP